MTKKEGKIICFNNGLSGQRNKNTIDYSSDLCDKAVIFTTSNTKHNTKVRLGE